VATEDALHNALDSDARNISITKSMELTGARAQGSTHFLLGAPGTHIRLQGLCNAEGEPTVTIDAAGTSKRHFGLATGSSVTLKCLKLSNVRLLLLLLPERLVQPARSTYRRWKKKKRA
jgi:hypothetical protein